MDDYEKVRRLLHEQLDALRDEYRKAAQPIIDRLVAMENSRVRPFMVVFPHEPSELPISPGDAIERVRAAMGLPLTVTAK